MPKELVSIDPTEVSGVDRAANRQRFLVIKSADPEPVAKTEAGRGKARSFSAIQTEQEQAQAQREKAWPLWWNLDTAIQSILEDDTVSAKKDAIAQSLDQYLEALVVKGVIVKAGKPAPTKTEEGIAFPAEAFAYVPDPETPSTWKLRLWEDLAKQETAAQVGRAVAALGKGFRGNQVALPDADREGVLTRVRAAWQRVNPDARELPAVLEKGEPPVAEKPNTGKPNRLAQFLKGLFGAEVEANPDLDGDGDPEKDAQLQELVEVLYKDLDAILDAEDLPDPDKKSQIAAALAKFQAAMEGAGLTGAGETSPETEAAAAAAAATPETGAAEGAPAEEPVAKEGKALSAKRMQTLKEVHSRIGAMIAEASGQTPGPTKPAQEPAQPPKAQETPKAPEPVAKSEENDMPENTIPEAIQKAMDDLKSQNAALQERLTKAEEIAKAEQEMRIDREYVQKAEAYAQVGAAAELGPILKAMHQANPETAAKLEAILKAAQERIVKGALFSELGTSNSQPAAEGDELVAKAQDIAKAEGISLADAMRKASKQNPGLANEHITKSRTPAARQ